MTPIPPADLLARLSLTTGKFNDYVAAYHRFLDSLDPNQKAFYKRTKQGHLEDVAAALTASLGVSVTASDLTDLINSTPSPGMLIAVSCCDNG
jgi:hypothetical protein